ncbi:MAG: TRAP transporter small permease [Tissierellia bacterium]|nr:TRAP transporter small permease [Tissierellia bacterium]
MRKVLNKIISFLGGLSFSIMVLLVCWQVFTRYILNHSATWTEELTSYLFAWMALLGASLITGERGHMNIPVIVERFNANTQRIIALITEVLIFLFSLIILVYGGISITKLAMGQMTSSLDVPIGLFYIILPLVGIINMLYSILNIIDIKNNKITFSSKNSLVEAAEDLGGEN